MLIAWWITWWLTYFIKTTFYTVNYQIRFEYNKPKWVTHRKTIFKKVEHCNTSIWTYSAFIDDRLNERMIRILSLIPHDLHKIYCHVQSRSDNNKQYDIVKGDIVLGGECIYPFCGWKPSIVICVITRTVTPVLVSLSCSKSKDVLTKHRWIFLQPVRNISTSTYSKLGICLSTMFNKDINDVGLIIEWVEFHVSIGIETIFLYGLFNISENVSNIIKYYETNGILRLVPWNLPIPSITINNMNTFKNVSHMEALWNSFPNINDKKQYNIYTQLTEITHVFLDWNSKLPCISNFAQHLAYLDCLYTNMADYKYLFFHDLDEFITPQTMISLPQMLSVMENNFQKDTTSGFLFKEAYFLANITNVPRIQGIYSILESNKRLNKLRIKDPSSMGGSCYYKSVIKPYVVVNMYIHDPREVLPGMNSSMIEIPEDLAYLYHYRFGFDPRKYSQSELTYVEDNSMSMYRDIIHTRIREVVECNKLHY